jgi:hypothetical protein
MTATGMDTLSPCESEVHWHGDLSAAAECALVGKNDYRIVDLKPGNFND